MNEINCDGRGISRSLGRIIDITRRVLNLKVYDHKRGVKFDSSFRARPGEGAICRIGVIGCISASRHCAFIDPGGFVHEVSACFDQGDLKDFVILDHFVIPNQDQDKKRKRN